MRPGNRATRLPRPSSDEEKWAALHRSERTMAILVACALGLSTLYIVALNAWILREAVPPSFTLGFSAPPGAAGATYAATVEWDPAPAGEALVRPRIYLHDELLPEDDASRIAPRIALGSQAALRIDVPAATSPGLHRGELVLRRDQGATSELPELLTAPLSVEVTSGIWGSWFVVRYWLAIVVALGALFYLACWIQFPAPQGVLVVREPPRRLGLRMRPIAWLLPWQRSSVRLRTLWRRARLPVAPRLDGELLFVAPGIPPMLLVTRKRGQISRGAGGLDAGAEAQIPCGPITTLYAETPHSYSDSTTNSSFVFWFERRARNRFI